MNRHQPACLRVIVLSYFLLVLAACGGGGSGGGDDDPPGPPVNEAPTAAAGADRTVQPGNAVNLSGTGTDTDGTIVSYAWEQTAPGSPAVTLSGATTPNASFTAPTVTASTAFTFSLTVTDNAGGAGTDSVTVTVAPAVPTSVTVSGRITFDRVPANPSGVGLNYGGITQQPARAVTVQAIAVSNGATIAETVTNASGDYSLTVPPNTMMSLRVMAQMVKTDAAPTWNFKVVDNTAANATYALNGANFNSGVSNQTRSLNAPSGFSTSGAATVPRSAGPFAILDSVYLSYQKVLGADATAQFAPLSVGWSPNNKPLDATSGTGVCNSTGNIGTSYYSAGNICVLGAANTDTDEYDDHVLIHEWGHYFEDNFSRSDTIGGSHGGGDRLDMRVAFGEGFGNALSGIVTDDPIYRDSNGGNQSGGFTINVEANPGTSPGTNRGWFSEASVQSILYDLYDATADGADNLALGFTPLYQVLIGSQRTGAPLTSIFSFITALKTANAVNATDINAIVNAQSINGNSIDAYGSMEANTGGDSDVLPVYSALVVNASAVNRCSTATSQTYNGVGNRRFFRFTVTSAGLHTFRAGGALADASMVLYQAGTVLFRDDQLVPGGIETESISLPTGTYVLEVFDDRNVSGGTAGRYCFDVSVTR